MSQTQLVPNSVSVSDPPQCEQSDHEKLKEMTIKKLTRLDLCEAFNLQHIETMAQTMRRLATDANYRSNVKLDPKCKYSITLSTLEEMIVDDIKNMKTIRESREEIEKELDILATRKCNK